MHKIFYTLKKQPKISKTYLVFLVLSILLWFLITLSKEYSTSLIVAVNYTNIPQDKIIQTTPDKEIELLVKASGFNLIKAKIGNSYIDFNVKEIRRKSNNLYYFLTKNQSNNIQKQLPSGIQLQKAVIDTLSLELGSLLSKKVPLIPSLDLSYQVGYDITKSVKIIPDSVLISGPKTQIDKVNKIDLELLKRTGIKADFSEEVTIVIPQNNNGLKINTKKAIISGTVEKITEGTFQIPFKIINIPKGLEVTTLAKTVKVVFVIGLSNFNKIDENFFEVVCDYSTTLNNNLNYLIPKVTVKSNILKNYKLVPNKIDFLIQK